MGKQISRYLEVEPWGLLEKGFHKERNQVSESLFSLGNEYCGVRGFFEEGSSLPSLIGTYYNGIIEYALEEVPTSYKGIVKKSHFTINSTNFLECHLEMDGETLDLGKSEISSFLRSLDFRTGLLERSFVWKLASGKQAKLSFSRVLGMKSPHEAIQKIEINAEKTAHLDISFSLDATIMHWGNHCYWDEGEEYDDNGDYGLFAKTPTTKQSLLSLMRISSPCAASRHERESKKITVFYSVDLKAGEPVSFLRQIINLADTKGNGDLEKKKALAKEELSALEQKGLAGLLEENRSFFKEASARNDIEIGGDEADQQGIRFCLFNLLQAYNGLSGDDNIGAKGLTGEAYSGHAFWDSETYCLPYYLFTNQKAAKDLLLFRYNTLDQAKKRARELDCEGACFPIATRNGEEACTLWQHASTQLQATTGVAYGIFHYMSLFSDDSFMKEAGAEMLLEISKFLLSRGQWNPSHSHFGYYGVMGPDEFEVMVNHNTYTNFMAQKCFRYTIGALKDPSLGTPSLFKKCHCDASILKEMEEASDKMLILYDPATKLYEQHEGYYDLPHIDVDKIPVSDFPLYSHWSYDRIYRNDMIKQPDVLMFMFLHDQDFSLEQKKANFDFYEPRCIHESSLSPSVHSILAEEIGYENMALKFFSFATRLDLDDYNRNTNEGLHMTSIAAAWMNIVYGFLGLRSDKDPLSVSPKLPAKWTHYSVRLVYKGARLAFKVYKDKLVIENSGEPVTIMVYGHKTLLSGKQEFKR